jgi:4-amino-4-deoxy-L-arabinose transferase-like glycosyltransferase
MTPGMKLFGFQLWWGRFLSILAFITCLFFIYGITKKITRNKHAAAITLLVSLALFPTQAWTAIMRPDFLATAFALGCLRLTLNERENANTPFWRIFLIVLIAVAAFFVKQTTLLPIMIIAFRFWQIKKLKSAGILIGLFVISLVFGILVLNYTSSGGYVWQHFIHAGDLPFVENYLGVFINGLVYQPSSWIFAICLFIFLFLYIRSIDLSNLTVSLRILRSPQFLIFIYLCLSLGWALISSHRVGANVNYFIENSLIAAILAGIIFKFFHNQNKNRLVSIMLVLMTFGGCFQMIRLLRGEYFRWQAFGYYQMISDVAAQLTPSNSKCISIYPELVIKTGCTFHFDDYSEYTSKWSQELNDVFEQEVNSGRYKTIVWNSNNFGLKFPNYRLVPMSQNPPERFHKVYLYVWEPKEK